MNETSVLLEQLSRYYALWRESTFIYEEWAKEQGLSFNSVMVLYSIHEDGDTNTQKMISQKWVIPKQTVNTILKDFEQRGLIELVPLPADKRNKLIRPTPAGKQYADEIIAKLRSLELLVLKNMGLERIQQLNDNMALFIELFNSGAGGFHEKQ